MCDPMEKHTFEPDPTNTWCVVPGCMSRPGDEIHKTIAEDEIRHISSK